MTLVALACVSFHVIVFCCFSLFSLFFNVFLVFPWCSLFFPFFYCFFFSPFSLFFFPFFLFFPLSTKKNEKMKKSNKKWKNKKSKKNQRKKKRVVQGVPLEPAQNLFFIKKKSLQIVVEHLRPKKILSHEKRRKKKEKNVRVEEGTGVLWVSNGTHPCDAPIQTGWWEHQSANSLLAWLFVE